MPSSRLTCVLLVVLGACTTRSEPAGADAGTCAGSTRSPLCDGARLVATMPFPIVRIHADGDKLLVLVDAHLVIGDERYSPDLYQVAIDGSGAPSLVVAGLDAASYDDAFDGYPDIGFDATYAYVGKGGPGRVPLAGGPLQYFVGGSAPAYEGLGVGGGRAFFKAWDPTNPSCVDVVSVPTDPTQPGFSFHSIQTCAAPKAGVADGFVYLWDPFDRVIYRVPEDSTVTQTTPEAVGGASFPSDLAYDAPDWIYADHGSDPYELDWMEKPPGSGGGSRDIPNNGVIAADATGVYFFASGEIERLVPPAATTQIVFPDSAGVGLALDDTSIYFADESGPNAIYAIPKPSG